MNDCESYEEALALKALGVDPGRNGFEAHLAACAACRASLDELRALARALAEPPAPVDELAVARLHDAVMDQLPARLPLKRLLAIAAVALFGFYLAFMVKLSVQPPSTTSFVSDTPAPFEPELFSFDDAGGTSDQGASWLQYHRALNESYESFEDRLDDELGRHAASPRMRAFQRRLPRSI